MIFRASGSHLEKVHHFLRCEIYSLTPKVTPRGEICGGGNSFCKFKNFCYFWSHLGNGSHIEKLRMGP